MPLFENAKLQFIQKGIFSFKTSYISVCSKTFLRLSDGVYIYIYVYVYVHIYMYMYKWPYVIQDTQSAQISHNQDMHNINVIMKTMCPPGYHHNGFVTVHQVSKCTI